MHKVDPTEAPEGYHAISVHDIKGPPLFCDPRCNGCHFKCRSKECLKANCKSESRIDQCDVVFNANPRPTATYYRALLLKYIAHVRTCEGVDFIDPDDSCPAFTTEEWAELRKLSKEAKEMKPSGT